MKRVLVVAPQPFFSARGTPLSVYYRTLVMAEQGVSIDLLTYGAGQNVDLPRVRIIRIPHLSFLDPVPVGPSWQKLLLDLPMVLWTLTLLIRHRYHAVHAHEESVFWCRPLKTLFGFRLVYDMHSSLPQQLTNFRFSKSRWLIRLFERLERRAIDDANVVITVCPELSTYAQSMGVGDDRGLLIENSLFDEIRLRDDPAGIADQPDHVARCFPGPARVVLYAGTFEAYQGLELLVIAFSSVARQVPDARLLLVGGTDAQIRRLRETAQRLGVDGHLHFTGHVPKNRASALMRSAAVLVSPRLHGNNTPLKIYEQLASGKPLVATRILSHTQVLDDSVCFLVEPEPESLAAGLIAALTSDLDTRTRTRNALNLYERAYSRSVYDQKIRQLLRMIA
jgi:glycosyltransferase involved in cell wall biosynthesis